MKLKPLYMMGASKPSYYLDESNALIKAEDIKVKDIELEIPEQFKTKINNINPLKLSEKLGFYTLGNLELQKSYSSFAGIDIRLFYKLQFSEKWETLGVAQNVNYQSKQIGTIWSHEINLSAILLDQHFFNENLKIDEMFAFAVNEYGQSAVIFYTKNLAPIEFTSGFSINDTIITEYIRFCAEKLQTQFAKEELDFYTSIVLNKGK